MCVHSLSFLSLFRSKNVKLLVPFCTWICNFFVFFKRDSLSLRRSSSLWTRCCFLFLEPHTTFDLYYAFVYFSLNQSHLFYTVSSLSSPLLSSLCELSDENENGMHSYSILRVYFLYVLCAREQNQIYWWDEENNVLIKTTSTNKKKKKKRRNVRKSTWASSSKWKVKLLACES